VVNIFKHEVLDTFSGGNEILLNHQDIFKSIKINDFINIDEKNKKVIDVKYGRNRILIKVSRNT
jgi:hypothetical protein